MRIKSAYSSVLVLAVGVAVSFAIAVRAQTPSPAEAGITFPILELGNCGSKDECRDYCNQPENISACVKFAEEHGLMNEKEAARAEKFSRRLSQGTGPGGCRTPQECKSFCSNIQNLETCVRFAEEQGVDDRQVQEGRKILAYIQAGGQLPGGCTSKESCEKYCGDFSHAEECFRFAERAGIVQVREEVPGEAKGRFEGGIPPGQFQKFLELVKRNETPGGCKSKDECENYCRSADHFEECVAFGEKVGFIEPEEAQKIRQTGGFGPGGCNSPDSCRNYCNDPSHREECFRFAEEHGFINKEEIERAKEGLIHLRAGLEGAPPEVTACIKSVVGPNIIEDIQSGKLTPGSDIGERVRQCWEKFGQTSDSRRLFSDTPPEVTACLKEKLGDLFEKARSGEMQPTPEMADALRVCFSQVQFRQGKIPGGAGGFAPDEQVEVMPDKFYEFLRSAPPQIVSCLREELGDNYERLKAGEIRAGTEVKEEIEKCFKEFRPQLRRPLSPKMCEPIVCPDGSKHPTCTPDGNQIYYFRYPCDVVTPPVRDGAMCPAMPTVSECPPGQEKVVVFKSEECGVYYGCKEKDIVVPPRPDGVTCIQVITPAQNPETGECRKFPTPCDVPPGWKHGCENVPPQGGIQAVDPTQLLRTFVAPLAPQTVAPETSAFICRSLEECAKYCTDPASPYLKTAECERWRSGSNISQ